MTDIYEDIKTVNSLRGLGSGAFRRNPAMEDFLAASQGMQNLFANQMRMNALSEAMQERKDLKKVLAGMDMQNPDFNKIVSIAPQIGLNFMENMTKLNTQQRLLAASKATQAMQYFNTALPKLFSMGPDINAYNEVVSNLKNLGVDENLIGLVPHPEKYQGNLKAWQTGIGLLIDEGKTMEGIAKTSLEGAKQETEKIKGQYDIDKELIKERTKKYEVDVKMAMVKAQRTGKPQLIEKPDGSFSLVQMKPEGGVRVEDLPGKPFKPSAEGKKKGEGKEEEEYGRKKGGTLEFKPGTYRINGKLVYIESKEKFEALTK